MTPANELTAALLIEIPKRFPNLRVWRANRIKALAIGRGGKPRMINAGVDGQGDVTGIAAVTLPCCQRLIGLKIEFEIKAGRDRQSQAQKDFQAMIESHGGIYILARDVEQALGELRRRLACLTEVHV